MQASLMLLLCRLWAALGYRQWSAVQHWEPGWPALPSTVPQAALPPTLSGVRQLRPYAGGQGRGTRVGVVFPVLGRW
mgnify:CR=1 FL=1